MVISSLVEAIVSVKRISSFLDSDELQNDARDIVLKGNIQDGDEVLSITHGEFLWSKDAKEPILQDINLTVKKGELIAILGQVGAGKVGVSPNVLLNLRKTDRCTRSPEQFIVCHHWSDEEDGRQSRSVRKCCVCPSEPLVSHQSCRAPASSLTVWAGL
jgi:ATPase subunit of ABC transporter with duplicated ATPase domains